MRTTTAYFAGVGTVAVALAAGLGGGLLFSSIVAPHQPKYAAEPTKLEQRMADRTIAVKSAPSEPAPSAQPTAATPVVAVAPAQSEPQTPTPQVAVAPPAEQKVVAEPKTSEPKTANNEVGAGQATPSPQAEPSSRATATSPREAFAKARDADMKRAITEKRRAERHPQWADKRRIRQPREQDLEAVEQSVRDVTEPRQAFMAEPARLDTPRIRLFGDD
jgi:hypothetical protein